MNDQQTTQEPEQDADTSDQVQALVMREFRNGMTVRELKEMVKDWPETNLWGEDCEVWVETGHASSSPVTRAGALNLREDDEDGSVSADIIFKSSAFCA